VVIFYIFPYNICCTFVLKHFASRRRLFSSCQQAGRYSTAGFYKQRFAASIEYTPLFHALNNFLRKKHKEGITFHVWVVKDPKEGNTIQSTAFPDYLPK